MVGISSKVIILSAAIMANLSTYPASKMAMTKVFEIFAAENPELYVSTIHPGVIVTCKKLSKLHPSIMLKADLLPDMFHKSGFAPPVLIPDAGNFDEYLD